MLHTFAATPYRAYSRAEVSSGDEVRIPGDAN